MPFIPIPNGIQLCFDFVTAGQFWQICVNLRKVSGPVDATALAGAASVGSAWWTSDLATVLTSDNTLRQVRATDMTNQGGSQVQTLVGGAGAVTPPMLPLGTPVVVSLRTAKRGRSYRGRVYLSGVAESNRASGSPVDLTTGFAGTTLPARFSALLSSLASAGFNMIVASKQHNNVPTNPAVTNDVTAFVVDTHLDSQRRRLSGRGT